MRYVRAASFLSVAISLTACASNCDDPAPAQGWVFDVGSSDDAPDAAATDATAVDMAADEGFGCLSDLKPRRTPMVDRAELTLRFEMTDPASLQGANVRVCDQADHTCEGPVSTTGAELITVVSVPTAGRGFEGFVELAGPAVHTTRMYLVPPVTSDEVRVMPVFARQELEAIRQGPLLAGHAQAMHYMFDCSEQASPSVGAYLDGGWLNGQSAVRYEHQDGWFGPPDTRETGDSGRVLMFDLRPGTAITHGNHPPLRAEYGRAITALRPDTLTISSVAPFQDVPYFGCDELPAEPTQPGPYTLRIELERTEARVANAPLPDVDVYACDASDEFCSSPLAEGTTDAQGAVELVVPGADGWDGYLQVSGGDTMNSIVYLNRPVVRTNTVLRYGIPTPASAEGFAAAAMIDYDPAQGALLAQASDCTGAWVTGLQIDVEGNDHQPIYLYGRLPDPDAGETLFGGLAGQASIATGRTVVNMRLDDQIVGSRTVWTRAGWITVARVRP